jgi:hypothetical protein
MTLRRSAAYSWIRPLRVLLGRQILGSFPIGRRLLNPDFSRSLREGFTLSAEGFELDQRVLLKAASGPFRLSFTEVASAS